MKINTTKLEDVIVIEPTIFGDSRGFFTENYSKKLFIAHNLHYDFIQDNHSLTVEQNTLRGLHYQLNPQAQSKLIRVITGSILDVVVDIRKNSPTYGEYISMVLSDKNHKQILIPSGFAHGFLTLESNVHLVYKVDQYYSKECDRSLKWNDKQININWGIDSMPFLSEKDKNAPLLKDIENNFDYR